jgi:hypothetical protein
MPTLLQSFLKKLDNIEQGLKQDWEAEQQQRRAELQHMPQLCLRRTLSGGLPSSLELPSLPLSNPDDIVAENRSGMRSERVCMHTAMHNLISSRGWHGLQSSSPLAGYPLSEHVLYDSAPPAPQNDQFSPVEGLQPDAPPHPGADRALQGSIGIGGSHPDASHSAAMAEVLSLLQERVKILEELVGERMEPIARHIAGMKRRMVSAQEEAQELRLEMENMLKNKWIASITSQGSVLPELQLSLCFRQASTRE